MNETTEKLGLFDYTALSPENEATVETNQSTDIDLTYSLIVENVMEYILEKKSQNKSAPLLDMISDYCMRSHQSVELVGDAIANDVYFKSFIEEDCELHNIIRSKKKQLDKW